MKLATIINVDTRDGWLEEKSLIGEYGNVSLCGCRSVDFFTHGVIAKNRYLESPLITERNTVLCIDVHNPIPDEVQAALDLLVMSGEITKIVARQHTKEHKHWNELNYCRSLAHADGEDFVAHWDGDTIGYRRPDFDVLALYLDYLDAGSAYVCQQTPLSKEAHCMEHASTRFFLTRRETLDLAEAERLLDDKAKRERFPGQHLPCLEHILGAMSGNRVLYPPCQNEDFLVWSWVHYFAGTIEKLNALPYEEVKRIVFDEWGGPLGASDVIAKPI